jgi:uncharacterized protein
MNGVTDLALLLSSLAPQLLAGEFVFCTLQNARYGDHVQLSPLASFEEREGLTLILPRESADESGFTYDTVLRCITLTVHSSLDAVGLTAAVAGALAAAGISANVFAAYYHDHILVPSAHAIDALAVLEQLGASNVADDSTGRNIL